MEEKAERIAQIVDRHIHSSGATWAWARSILPSRCSAATMCWRAQGGDEFVILLRGVSEEEKVQAVRLKIDHALQQPLSSLQGVPAGEQVSVGASAGQALFPRDAQDAQTLLKMADQNMYRNKGPSAR